MIGVAMGLITGSWSFTRFQVEDPPPEDHLALFTEKILQYAFRPLDETSDLERSSGWVDIVDMFDNLFPGRSFLRPPFLSLSWRVDARSIPSHALKQYCMDWENKIKEEEDLEFLSKKRRQEIRERGYVQLLRRAIPRSKTYDMVWNLETGLVYFGSVSEKLCDEFSEFFFITFGLPLKNVFPYTLAQEFLEKEGMGPEMVDQIQDLHIGEDR